MYNIKIGGKYTYTDWNLKATNISIGFPEVKTKQVDIAAAHGILNMSRTFGEEKYGNRTISMSFTFDGDYDIWQDKISEIAGYLHGNCLNLVFVDSDPDYFYNGTFTISTSKENDVDADIQISCDAYPFKRKIQETVVTQGPCSEAEIILPCGKESVLPMIKNSQTAQIVFGEKSFSVNAGTHERLLGFRLTKGENHVIVTTTGQITFQYREGDL